MTRLSRRSRGHRTSIEYAEQRMSMRLDHIRYSAEVEVLGPYWAAAVGRSTASRPHVSFRSEVQQGADVVVVRSDAAR